MCKQARNRALARSLARRAHFLAGTRTLTPTRAQIMGLQRFKLNIANSIVNEDNASLKSMVCVSFCCLPPALSVNTQSCICLHVFARVCTQCGA